MGEEREGGKKASEAGEESSPAACNTPATAIGGVAAEIGPGDVRNDTRFVHGVDTYYSDSLKPRTVKRLSYKKNKEKSSGSSRNQSDVR